MSNLRKVRNTKKERYDIAIQPDPADFEQVFDQPKKKFQYDIKSATLPNSGQKSNSKRTAEVIQGLERAQQLARIQEAKIRASPLQNKKNVALNMMRLQDKSFDIQRNIYNISIGDLAEKQGYLSSLQEEIRLLKSKIGDLEEDQNQRFNSRTITNNQQSEVNSQNASRTIEQRRSFCGRIYNRRNTPNSKTVFKLSGKSQQEASSYYKWHPKLQVSEFKEDQINRRQASHQNYPDSKRNRSTSNYRVKQGSQKPSTSNNLKSEQKVKSQSKQMKLPQKVEITQQPQQLKRIFFEKPEWQIENINDDFRAKIMKKLQIPSQFPLQQPDITDTLQEYQKRSAQIYKIFGINTDKCKQRIVVRKFKNGVYYQMKPNKNIVWYFTGAFYFGDWDTDLPSQAQKNGFGFEYVPEKYYYLGQFKNGNRCGKGSIKIINNSSQFMAYDGEWLNGKPHGKGNLIDEKNNRYIGQFDQGQKTGRAIVLNRDGLYFQGEMKKGLKHGFGMEKLVNLDVYEGQFLDGKFHGQGVYKWKNGSIYQGQFVAGKRQGKGIWKSYNGDVFEGDYFNDVKHGWGKFTWKNGQIYEGQFSNDIRDGIGEYKHPNGKLGKYLWKNGHIDHRIQDKIQEPNNEQKPPIIQGDNKEIVQE